MFPLRIYTALKSPERWLLCSFVCFPYEFTLLSNRTTFIQFVCTFVSPTNLHCSQTVCLHFISGVCLFPLRIYTALKPPRLWSAPRYVCFPYEFTLLSNNLYIYPRNTGVCFPYEFTLLSNGSYVSVGGTFVCFPYEFTLLSNIQSFTRHSASVCFPYEFTLLSNLKLPKNNILQNTSIHS